MSSKDEFNKWLESSGANQLVAKSIVNLALASSEDASVNPAVCLRDFFFDGAKGAATNTLSAAEKEAFGAFLNGSGATDLITKAIVGLFDLSPRPAKPSSYFLDFFTKAAGGAKAPPASKLNPDAPQNAQ